MPTDKTAVKKRLDNYTTLSDLTLANDRRRILNMLNFIKEKKEEANVTAIKNKCIANNAFTLAALEWMEERGYIEKKDGSRRSKVFSLTEKGEEARRQLNKLFLFQTIEPRLNLRLNLGTKSDTIITLESTEPSEVDKLAIFSNRLIRERLVELSTLLSQTGAPTTLTIQLPQIKEKSIPHFAGRLWSFYLKVVDISDWISPSLFHLDMSWMNTEYSEKYEEFWKKYLTDTLENKEMRSLLGFEQKDIHSLFPQTLQFLPELVQNGEIRRWVEERLEEDPDWFMPHYFWVQLGFKQCRNDLETFHGASPPSFIKITSPTFGEMLPKLDNVLYFIERKKLSGESSEIIYGGLMYLLEREQTNPELYKSWALLRDTYRDKMPEISDILDNAMLACINPFESPDIDLHSAFHDFLYNKRETKEVRKAILNGEYKL